MDQVTPIKTQFRMEQWIQLIQEQQASGMTVRAWCHQAEIRESSYYYWLKRIRQQACDSQLITRPPATEKPMAFARLQVSQQKVQPTAAVIIQLPSATVEVMNGASKQTIEAVLQALNSPC